MTVPPEYPFTFPDGPGPDPQPFAKTADAPWLALAKEFVARGFACTREEVEAVGQLVVEFENARDAAAGAEYNEGLMLAELEETRVELAAAKAPAPTVRFETRSLAWPVPELLRRFSMRNPPYGLRLFYEQTRTPMTDFSAEITVPHVKTGVPIRV